ncbi:polysaccharide pyruvyl transferase family protein [Celeribacter indicus]|uniref:ExoV domain-containing protein n=1 Tax=Celeribacter indicus TaxID=1208324 RepID=A0A0B5E6D8_9RHOB|nr:polysaccharide pyruvyl transferase family protein [Celeribacter indicus]AJE48576.1 exoV domain-containing protein [Celeribacter indicus]SDX08850.1 Polysaccharide pyruvyl transferase [Celeribacter indicus]
MTLKLFWWNEQPNFGDRISGDIVAHVSGQEVEWAPPRAAALISTGSIMSAARRSFKSGRADRPWIWGTGAMKPLPADFVDHVRIAALRGPVTRELLGAETEIFGDPGLLMPFVLGERIAQEDKIGIVPHQSRVEEITELLRGSRQDLVVIDPRAENHLDVVREIASCKAIFSSSLHGLIIADAFGVPNVWLDPAGNHPFARLKFYDYAAGIGRALPLPVPLSAIGAVLEAGVPGISYAEGIRAAQHRLFDSFPTELKTANAPKVPAAFEMEVAV